MLKRLLKSAAYSTRVVRIVEALESKVPGLSQWHRMQYKRHFERVANYERIFSGAYPDFVTAKAHIPKGRPVGYDNLETATFLGREAPLLPSEYPILFWLAKLLPHSPSVFDFGGYLGVLYNAYQRFGIYPEGLRWTVYDVPAVVAAGKQILTREPDERLRFTTDFADAAGAGILLGSGAIHFDQAAFADTLAGLQHLPEHLLINKMPATDGEQFWTLNNMGPAISPYKVVNRAQFIASIEALDYALVDRWRNPDLSCFIPFHPEKSVKEFDGFYFRRMAPKRPA